MMKSLLDRRWLSHTVKNFLRLSKGRGFKEIVFCGSKGTDNGQVDEHGLSKDMTYSEFYLEKARILLLDFDNKVGKDFLNSVFSSLNDITSELLMVLKEEAQQQNQFANRTHMIRRTRFYIDLIVDLTRILELVSKWVPEVFLHKD